MRVPLLSGGVLKCALLSGVLAGLAGCAGLGARSGETSDVAPKIDAVFMAQQHVLEPDAPLFKLVGDLEALIKVQVYSETGATSPLVLARLELEGATAEIVLHGPARLPRKPDVDPVLMEHRYDDSFTAMIPAEWVKTGLKVTVELRDFNYLGLDVDDMDYSTTVAHNRITVLDRRVFDELKVGAPSRVVMQMFDIHYFGGGVDGDHPEGWERELEAKLPVSELVVHRVRGLMFNELVMPPIMGQPSRRYTSLEDFEAHTGKPYDGEQGIALRWGSALKAAGGRAGLWRPYHINICGVPAGGQAGGYRSCSSIHRHGVIIHELGHTFGLPHWNRHKAYPYKRTMYGADQGEPASANAGPTWAFDLGRRAFLSPRKKVDGEWQWKKDPMQGGGQSGLKDYMYNHFSDFAVHRMRTRMENGAVYWNADLGAYARWNQDTGAYDKVVENDGLLLPIERDVDVVSILASANVAVPQANIIYDPIGPYTGGLVRLFDAESADDRAAAEALGYLDKNCNVCLRVRQGGQVRTYLLRARVSPDDDPMKAFTVAAINLPARDGAVSAVDLLYCPDVLNEGVPPTARVLDAWRAPAAGDGAAALSVAQ